jgi:hypothetical protein
VEELHREDAGHAEWLAGAQGEEHGACVEIGGAERVEDAKAKGGEAEGVDAGEQGEVDRGLRAADEAPAAEPQPRPAPEHGQERAPRARGEGLADALEGVAEDARPLVDASVSD